MGDRKVVTSASPETRKVSQESPIPILPSYGVTPHSVTSPRTYSRTTGHSDWLTKNCHRRNADDHFVTQRLSTVYCWIKGCSDHETSVFLSPVVRRSGKGVRLPQGNILTFYKSVLFLGVPKFGSRRNKSFPCRLGLLVTQDWYQCFGRSVVVSGCRGRVRLTKNKFVFLVVYFVWVGYSPLSTMYYLVLVWERTCGCRGFVFPRRVIRREENPVKGVQDKTGSRMFIPGNLYIL